jgi:hypothetical protein
LDNKQNITNIAFNIYYLNFSKVYEISMMINNVLVSSIQKEKSSTNERSKSRNSSISAGVGSKKYLADVKAVIGNNSGEKITNSSKLIESLDVKTTKSILLKQIEQKCSTIINFSECIEGDLIKLDHVKLMILNEENLRQFKLLRSDALKGYNIEGLDINNLLTSMLKDYSYVLYGQLANSEEEIVIKIPMELENEFESKYNLDDLLIGNVSVIGVFKGDVSEQFINSNTFNYLVNLSTQGPVEENKVFSSVDYQSKTVFVSNSNRRFKFIDVIAIIQNVNFKQNTIAFSKKSWFEKIYAIFKKKDEKNE